MASVVRVINSIRYDACDMRTDSYAQWGAKQDLYKLKQILDKALKDCPYFTSVEDDWLKEQEQKEIIRILKDEV